MMPVCYQRRGCILDDALPLTPPRAGGYRTYTNIGKRYIRDAANYSKILK